MLRDDAVTLIAQRLGERSDLTAEIILQMQLTQEFELEQNGKFQPWFMVTEAAAAPTVAGENRLALPDDFVMEVEEGGLWITDSAGTKHLLPKKANDELELKYKDYSPALPEAYSLIGDHMTLFPTPDDIYSVTMRYAAKGVVLNSNIENNWLKYAADLLIAVTGRTMASERLQNPNLAATFQPTIDNGWLRLLTMHEARQHTNRDYTMGED